MTRTLFSLAMLGCFLPGCMPPIEEQVKKDPNSIIGKKTQDIGQFNPAAGAPVSDSKIRATDPISAPVSAYGPMLEQISKTHIAHALNLFNATEGRYPNSYDEFMTRIIKENNIQLPVLPGGKKYQYDVENHQLVVIDAPADGAAAPADPAP
jgi:hypothetical protein